MKLMLSKASQIGSSESASSAWALLIWLCRHFLKSSRANSRKVEAAQSGCSLNCIKIIADSGEALGTVGGWNPH